MAERDVLCCARVEPITDRRSDASSSLPIVRTARSSACAHTPIRSSFADCRFRPRQRPPTCDGSSLRQNVEGVGYRTAVLPLAEQ